MTRTEHLGGWPSTRQNTIGNDTTTGLATGFTTERADEQSKAREQFGVMLNVLRGNTDAAKFCDDFFAITQIWDDLYDRDKPVCPEDVNRAFWFALVEIPSNSFYREHMKELTPLLRAFIADWFDANALEQGDLHDRTVAFVLRDHVGAIVNQCAYLIGGYDWMREVSPLVRRMIHDESLETYLGGLQ